MGGRGRKGEGFLREGIVMEERVSDVEGEKRKREEEEKGRREEARGRRKRRKREAEEKRKEEEEETKGNKSQAGQLL
ncbi:hypothetical protein PBY51_021956 [Eleginops maclovinus]|uniref:Uncharacterized protein n=1 Tax=Eleginops maclovinus TaxID=56733 RepID=A0AAN7XGL0_ELEMC|nr:hypothetical protein PBY51_021956 [Eleginops maclovinus]